MLVAIPLPPAGLCLYFLLVRDRPLSESILPIPLHVTALIALLIVLSEILVFVCNWIWHFRPLQHRVRTADWLLCPKCLHPFVGNDEVVCTECGTKFIGGDVRKAWQDWIKPLDAKAKR